MPLILNKRCKVCQVIDAGDNELLKRIYHCSKYRKNGESMGQIADDYKGKFTYVSLTQHAKRHQAINQTDLKRSIQAEIVKNGSNGAAIEIIKHGDLRQLVIEKGYKGIKSGKIKLKASDAIKAAKDQADVEAKAIDQGLTVAEMMMRIASGEIKPIGEPENGQIPGTNTAGPIEIGSNPAVRTATTSS